MELNYNGKLGICIPTYNRKYHLARLLDSLLEEIANSRYPIFISDNASTDGTETMILNFKKRYENIIYHRNDTNLGFYRNYLNSIQMAGTEYIWTLGDDDIVVKGGISKVISYLMDNTDFLLVNSIMMNRDMNAIKSKKVIECTQDIFYAPGGSRSPFYDLMHKEYNTAISSMIIRRRLLLELLPKYLNESFELFNNSFSPLTIFYEAIQGGTGVFICDPILKMRDDHRSDREDIWEYHFIDHVIAFEYLVGRGYNLDGYRKYAYKNLSGAIFYAVISKGLKPGLKLVNEFVKRDELLPLHIKYVITVIDIIPPPVIRILYWILQKLRG